MAATEKAPMRRKRAGMSCSQYEMVAIGDQSLLCFSRVAPQQKHDGLCASIQPLNYAVGKDLPTLASMRSGCACPHRQTSIEKKYSLFGPGNQAAVVRYKTAQVVLEFFEDVHQ